MLDFFLQPSYKSQKNKVCMESSWQTSLGTAQTKRLNKEAFIISVLLPSVITESPAVRLLASLNLSNKKHRQQSFEGGSERYVAFLRLAFFLISIVLYQAELMHCLHVLTEEFRKLTEFQKDKSVGLTLVVCGPEVCS